MSGISTVSVGLRAFFVLGALLTTSASPPENTVPLSVTQAYGPTYPLAAIRARIEGTVETRVVVGPSGGVERVEVTKSANPLMDQVSAAAAQRWRFENGPGQATLVFEFRQDAPDETSSAVIFYPPYRTKISAFALIIDKSGDPL